MPGGTGFDIRRRAFATTTPMVRYVHSLVSSFLSCIPTSHDRHHPSRFFVFKNSAGIGLGTVGTLDRRSTPSPPPTSQRFSILSTVNLPLIITPTQPPLMIVRPLRTRLVSRQTVCYATFSIFLSKYALIMSPHRAIAEIVQEQLCVRPCSARQLSALPII